MSLLINLFLFFVLSINIKYSSLTIVSEIEKSKICYKSNTNDIPNGNYEDLLPSDLGKSSDENVLSMIFLNEGNNSKYFNEHIVKYNKINIILYLLLAISVFIFFDFNIHFFCKIKKQKESIKRKSSLEENGMYKVRNTEKKNTSKIDVFFDFFKISPFCWVNYFFMKEVELKLYFTKYETKKLTKINIKIKYILSIISLLLFLLVASFALINLLKNSNFEKAIYNLSCGLVTLFNKLIDKSDNFIGLNKANKFFDGLNEKNVIIKSYKKKFNNSYNELQNKFSEWNSFLIKINNTLSDKSTMQFFFITIPQHLIIHIAQI